MPTYRAVRLFLKCGPALAVLVVVGLWMCLGWLAATAAPPWFFLAAGVVASLFAGFLILVFVDLTRIIAEMLLPR